MTTPDDQPHPPVPPVPAPASETPPASPYAAPAADSTSPYSTSPYSTSPGSTSPGSTDPYAAPASSQGTTDPYSKTTAYPPVPPAAAPPAYAYGAPTGPTEPRGLSIASMVTGIASIVIPVFPISIVAVILGHIAQRRQPAGRPFWLTGLITGYVGILFALVVLIGFILFFVLIANAPYSDYYDYNSDFSNAAL